MFWAQQPYWSAGGCLCGCLECVAKESHSPGLVGVEGSEGVQGELFLAFRSCWTEVMITQAAQELLSAPPSPEVTKEKAGGASTSRFALFSLLANSKAVLWGRW